MPLPSAEITVLPRKPGLRRLLSVPAKPVRGTPQGGHVRRVVVTLETDTFDRIAALAAASRVSFAEAIRQLVTLGFEQVG